MTFRTPGAVSASLGLHVWEGDDPHPRRWHGVPSVPYDHHVHALLAIKREIRGKTDPVQARQDEELGSKVRVVTSLIP